MTRRIKKKSSLKELKDTIGLRLTEKGKNKFI
jgi:hypothetical protein